MSEDEIISAVVKGLAKATNAVQKAPPPGSFGAAEVWGLLGGVVTAFGGVITVLIRMYAKSKDAIRDVYDVQTRALEKRLEEKDTSSAAMRAAKDVEIDRLVAINGTLQASLDVQRREQLEELKNTAPLVANAINKSTEAQNKSADAQLKLADAFVIMHRQVTALREDLDRNNRSQP